MKNFCDKDEFSLEKIGIVYNSNSNGYEKTVEEIKFELERHGLDYVVTNIDALDSTVTFAIVAGGDGTLLRAARFYAKIGRAACRGRGEISGVGGSLKKKKKEHKI